MSVTEAQAPAAEPAIRTEHLTKIYSQRLIAVNDMNLQVPRGSVFGLLGPNGAGKTTTLRLLLGLQRPTAGRAEVFGKLCGPNAVAVRSQIGYLPTNPKLPEDLRPIEYLDLLGKLSRLPGEVRKPRIASLLRDVGLLDATDQRIGTFSTGMCTRLGIAASLVGDPPLLIWDEPTAGLDPSARRFTLDLIRELGKTKTIVVATHILGDIDQVCDHLGVMHEGRMIFTGSMQDIQRRIGREDFTLELEGDPENISRLVREAANLEGVEVRAASSVPVRVSSPEVSGLKCEVSSGDGALQTSDVKLPTSKDNGTVLVRVADGRRRARALADILQLVDACGLSLHGVHSGQNATENAYLQLLQEDEAHGFHR
ncbi:MAG: ABC transporter ATP-binding protein [Phycisphaerae bacterium]|nr:ABC transporter ATP-binding protein [Phycisphaerae bacterium]